MDKGDSAWVSGHVFGTPIRKFATVDTDPLVETPRGQVGREPELSLSIIEGAAAHNALLIACSGKI